MTTTTRPPFTVWANYGGSQHMIREEWTLTAAQKEMCNEAEEYAAEGGGTVHIDGDRNAHVDLDGHTIARWTVCRRLDEAGQPLAQTAEQLAVADLVAAMCAECERLNVDDYQGEAVNFLGAVLEYARGNAATPEEAVRLAYGLDQ